MRTKELVKLEDIIKDILEKDYMARSDDAYLIFRVVQVTHPQLAGTTFAEVMLNAKKNKLNFESIRRCRQKLQATYPRLKDRRISEIRNDEQISYKEYALK